MGPAAVLHSLCTLRSALLLLLLVVACRPTTDEALAIELRCQCRDTQQRIHLSRIQSLTIIVPGPACPQTQVIATLKDGNQVCLDSEGPWVKNMIGKMLTKKTYK